MFATLVMASNTQCLMFATLVMASNTQRLIFATLVMASNTQCLMFATLVMASNNQTSIQLGKIFFEISFLCRHSLQPTWVWACNTVSPSQNRHHPRLDQYGHTSVV